MFYFSSNTSHTRSGFTLVELIISMAIISIISAVLLWGYNSTIARENLNVATNNIQTTLKQVQTDGTVSRRAPGVSLDEAFDRGFGIAFEEGRSDFDVYFGDDTTGVDIGGIIRTEIIGSKVEIASLCGGSNSSDCDSVDEILVLYRRPHLRPLIEADGDPVSYVEIELFSPRDDTLSSTIIITTDGIITTQ